MGRGFPAAQFRQGTEPVVFEPSPVHRAGGGRHSVFNERTEESARPALRHRGERHRAWRRFDSYSPTGRAEDGVRAGAADFAGGNETAVRLPAGGVSLRRAAARRHCAGLRPSDRDSLRHTEHPRRDRLSENGQRRRPHDQFARAIDAKTTA